MKKIMGAIDAARAAMPALQADGDMRKVAALKAEVEDIIYAVNKGGNTDMHIAKIHELLSSNVAEAALGNSNELRREVVAIFQELAAKLNSGEDITDDIVDELGDLHNDVLRSKDPELKYWYKRVRTIEPSRWKEALSKASRVLALSESKSPAYDKDTVDSIKKKSAMNEDISQDAHHMQQDHEVQMARSDLYKTANYAIKLHSLLKGVSEAEGIEGWMQAKITKAADYLGSVFHALEYDMIEKSAPVMPTMESPQPVAEAMRLDRDNLIHADADAQQFAKHYRAGMAGDYRAGGPSDKDTANSEKFHEIYDYEHTRSGFAGSGTTVYTNRKTGEQFEVDRNPNGKGFYGTDHYVSVVKNLGEAVAKIACVKCDEVSTAAAWKKNNGFCPKCKTSSQGVAESSDYAKRRKAADDEYYGKKKPTPAVKTVAKTDYQKRRETNEANTSAESFKLKVTNPATGNSEMQEFNSESALKAYKDRATQKGLKVSRVNNESVINEGDIVDFGAFAGMYSDGARVSFMDKQGQMHNITATGGVPREYTLDGKPISREKLSQITRGINLGRFQQGVDESLNEDYADRVNRLADYINQKNPNGVKRDELLSIIRWANSASGVNAVEMRDIVGAGGKTSNAGKEFVKDVAKKVKIARAKSERMPKAEILDRLSDIIQDAVSNSIPDGDPWDAIFRKARKLPIPVEDFDYNLRSWLDAAARKNLGAKSYFGYLNQMWNSYADGDFGNEPDESYRNTWGESIEEGKATLGAAVNRAEKSRQAAIRKAKAWMKRTGKSAADAAVEFDLLKGDVAKLTETTTAGSVAAVVMPMGKIQKRKK
jgi:hypothetical protein